MQLLIVRHAPAEELNDRHSSDGNRELTAKGKRLFREFAQKVILSDRAPELILHSPLIRCAQTAEILAEVIGLKGPQVRAERALSPGMSASQLATVTQSLMVERVAVVGHNPDVSYCTSQLIGGGSIEFKKGSMACIDFVDEVRTGLGQLVWFMSPKVLIED